jgi:hypothetical protein
VLRSGSPRLVIEEAWAWLTATHLVRASAATALRSEAAAACGAGVAGLSDPVGPAAHETVATRRYFCIHVDISVSM